jgi:phospholipid/cholesterol/gamma-HCH transport system substrate-binding protein
MAACLLAFFLMTGHAMAQGGTALLRVVLPEEGANGLEAGSDLLVLGLKAGTVRRIAFGPNQRLVAEAVIEEPAARDFIRRDAPVFVRQRLAGAGASYLFIGRGTGAALDWSNASLQAASEPSQTDAALAILMQLRDRAFPMLDDMARVSRAVGALAERTERGQGLLGRFLTDDRFAQSAEDATRDIAALVQVGLRLAERMDAIAAQAERLMAESGGPNSSLPALMRRMEQTLANLERATRDVTRASARLPQTLRNVEEGTSTLPALLLQSQQTTRELELLLAQLRGSWLLGGGGAAPADPLRPASERLRP